MANFVIGDIQGCYQGFIKTLSHIGFNPSRDTLFVTGDILARGENSLKVVEYLYQHQDSIHFVLGNHDLHFLSVANGIKPVNANDKLEPLLASPQLPVYCDWLRSQPILIELPNQGYLTHAGLAPHWSVEQAKIMAEAVSTELTTPNYQHFLASMYGNDANHWPTMKDDLAKLKYAVNAFTRMRFVNHDGVLDFKHKCAPEQLADNQLQPWFMYDKERFNNTSWCFGHWASLMGHCPVENLYALDTGYVWGNHFTVVNLSTQQLIQVHN